MCPRCGYVFEIGGCRNCGYFIPPKEYKNNYRKDWKDIPVKAKKPN